MKHAIRHIHFVGVGGSGMSGIAEVLLNLGYKISGSDLSDSATLRRLAGLGITTCVGHDATNIAGADAVVTSTAVQADNPEVVAAREKRIPVVPRALMLAELMRLKQGIAIAGTHGKTTTTSLVASVLAAAGLDPTFVIGGRLNSAGANAQLGSGDYIVVEADESDASFLNLLPVMAVVTNIDADHMETYGHDFAKLKKAFVDFLHRMPFYGVAILCTDDPAVREIVTEVSCPVTSYGFGEDAQVRAVNVRAVGSQMHFTAQRRNGVTLPDLDIVLNLPGEHNVRNALSVIAVAVELGVPDEAVQHGLADFKGVGRRFQRYGEVPSHDAGSFTLIDDYGHHPVEMAATIAAARGAFPGRRLMLAFQPHRFTRTRDCFEDFVKVIGQADAVLLGEVYAAGEAPIVAADGRSLARALRVAGKVEPVFVDEIAAMPQAILDNAREGDVVICMGAGSIGAVPAKVVELGGATVPPKSERPTGEGRAL
ncbi:UDP-N-acetylmuramate--L-alanine ligase [Variovorax sp. J22P240]|uniref:UDP-N-acetylmuramate--L-alanine ligase n=1 Tax=unclassified Variovorax TaxID=663243 RepID=UPI0025782D98|nr:MULTISPECIES: UDP-N-acetylmuramate--L-alanine ligase [unclassified Variovorax]MDM0000195.1 UDP-N-acetylmuramate--L-alanine ligase [Variovorax sp. J22P240]MDM0050288.1 UDP-N-acetylmuramate--L-alanine ligase [Variovorax sp. J22R115]